MPVKVCKGNRTVESVTIPEFSHAFDFVRIIGKEKDRLIESNTQQTYGSYSTTELDQKHREIETGHLANMK